MKEFFPFRVGPFPDPIAYIVGDVLSEPITKSADGKSVAVLPQLRYA